MTSSLIWVSDFIGSPLPPRVQHRLPDCAATAQGTSRIRVASAIAVEVAADADGGNNAG
jgi:hypothetical protein